MIDPAQCRAARAALGWSQEKLAKETGIGRVTIAEFEKLEDGKPLRKVSMLAIEKALSDAGVSFSEDGKSISWQGVIKNDDTQTM